jgi:hypothetical protein
VNGMESISHDLKVGTSRLILYKLKPKRRMKSMTIYLSNDETLIDFMLKMTKDKITKRYNLSNLSEDMGVSYAMLHRFVNKKPVGQKFFVKWFKFFIN